MLTTNHNKSKRMYVYTFHWPKHGQTEKEWLEIILLDPVEYVHERFL